jgi:surface antigen
MIRLAVATGLLLLAFATGAQNIGFLKRSAASELTREDEVYLQEALRQALEETPDKQQVDWKNPENGHFGNIRLLDTHEDFDTTCRTIRIFTSAGGREGGGRFRLCLADDDSWRFAPLRRPASAG